MCQHPFPLGLQNRSNELSQHPGVPIKNPSQLPTRPLTISDRPNHQHNKTRLIKQHRPEFPNLHLNDRSELFQTLTSGFCSHLSGSWRLF